MEKTPKNSSKKTPIIIAIAGLIVIGGGYLGGMHYISNKTMDFLHAQADKINASQKNHAEIQDEQRGLFTSTAKVIVSNDTSSISAPLTVRHGLFNTDIESDDVRFQDNGHNALNVLGGNAEKATLAIHLHNSSLKDNDLRGSSIALTLPSQISASENDGSRIMLDNPALKLERNSDGKLVASMIADKVESSEDVASFSNFGHTSVSLTYDAAWSEQLMAAGSAYAHDSSEQSRQNLETVLTAHLPDIHANIKDLKNRVSMNLPETSAEHFIIDIVRDPSSAVTRFAGNLSGIGSKGAANGNVIIKVALDQRIVDTAMNLSHRTDSNISQDVVALAQTSPRIVLEELRMFDNEHIALSATGEASLDGSSITSINDIGITAIIGKATIKGLPDGAAQMAEIYNIDGVKDGQPVDVTVNKGKVAINGKPLLF